MLPSSALGFVLAITVASTASAECPIGNYDVQLKVILAPVKIDRSNSAPELRRLYNESNSANPSKVLAFTDSLYGSSGTYHLDTDPTDNGYCVRVTGGNIWYYVRRTIYLPREVEPGSCVDHVLLEHERQHIAVSEKAATNELVPFLKARFTGPAPGVWNKCAGAAEDQAKATADKVLNAALDEYFEMLDERQRVIDERDRDAIDDTCGEGSLARLRAAFTP